ncbi:uncharacterized protein LOC113214133 [Frankliniella occidentalis]|uniref:DNA-directed DNA polymerase n=1 Tax=Frankliniella occidentalis TaxID=133901 RepID=A0A6J1T6F3_FRAOC|nr:uncharacterized protein LOC113214133 [Frankliniella occidentalis]XP_026289195.2 uncharacterized protein LOC113214133 [Frankliniella occidentalis]
MKPVEIDEGKKTRKISEHIPFLYTIIVIDHLGNRVLGPIVHANDGGVAEHFITKVLEIENELFTRHRKDFPKHMSYEQWEEYDRTTSCHLCGKKFTSHAEKVPDHCHLTPTFNYRNALHATPCNALRRRTHRLVAVAHNSNRYDSCIVMKAAVNHPALQDKDIKVIPKTKSHYLSFRINLGEKGRAIVFIDSFRHLMSGLDTLVNGLLPSDKIVLNKTFPVPHKRDLVASKGVYYYDYITEYDQLYETQLPPKEEFYSRVKGEGISDEMYAHAQKVFQTFECPNLLIYAIIYCVCDCALLCDVISSYRRTTWETFGLEAMRFVSGASLSWACALKKTRAEISLISDASHFNFCEMGIRGGQSVISTRFAQANHEECENYDPNAPKSWISLYDATALYGGTMTKSLPIGEFQWVGPEEYDPLKGSEEDEYAYIWMVDTEYPEELHAAHRDFPAMPERMKISQDMLSPLQHRLLEASGRRMPANDVRLVSHLGPRHKYVCHSLILKQYLEMGIIVTRVHKGLKFRQAPYLKPYLEYLTEKRAAAKSDFEAQYFKQKGNDIFGYSLKSSRHHVSVIMCRNEEKLVKMVKSPFFHSFEIFGPDLIAVQMKQKTVKLNYPVSLGMAILDKSKIYGYKLYGELKKQLGPSARLLCHDTDCWGFHYESDDFVKTQRSIAHMMDFSNYPRDHELYDESRKRIPLFLKDEHPGRMVTSFVGLRAKNYCLQFPDGKPVKKCKGVQRSAAEKGLTFECYKKCLIENYEKSLAFSYIRQDGKQTIYTWDTVKCALSNFDTKRYFCPDGIHTVPHNYRGPPIGGLEREREGGEAEEEDEM